ncbi:MAG: hypothetical protein ACRD36_00330, partial [Candidatus Acidiferrum sp.]
MVKRTAITAGIVLATLVLFATLLTPEASAQIAKVVDQTGRQLFVNADPPVTMKLTSTAPKPRATI